MSPKTEKLRRALFTDFGILLDSLPPEAHFRARRKLNPKGGSGRGQEVLGPSDWSGLGKYIDTLSWLRNAAAHGDEAKLVGKPQYCEGDLWLAKADGSWSVQQPHALTALRVVLATFNAVAVEISRAVDTGYGNLRSPQELDFP